MSAVRLVMAAVVPMVLVAGSCRPSPAVVDAARHAAYSCDERAVRRAALDAMEHSFAPLLGRDPTGRVMWSGYLLRDRSGQHLQWLGHRPGYPTQRYPHGKEEAFQVRLFVGLRPGADGWVVAPVPEVIEAVGSHRRLLRRPADWPEWVRRRVDSFYVRLYDRLGHCATDRRRERPSDPRGHSPGR